MEVRLVHDQTHSEPLSELSVENDHGFRVIYDENEGFKVLADLLQPFQYHREHLLPRKEMDGFAVRKIHRR